MFKSFTHAQTSKPSGLVTNLVVVLCASSSNVLWVTFEPGVTGANVGVQTMLCGNLDEAALVLPIVYSLTHIAPCERTVTQAYGGWCKV